jgi:N-acetylneuraminic acid mutarotase
MKKLFIILELALFTAWMITFTGCKKDVEISALYTTEVSGISATTAETGGNVTSNGGVEVTARGVCWSTSENPTVAENKTSDGVGTGIFTSTLTGLNPRTTYFVRAYAINSPGVAYGNQIVFETTPAQGNKADLPGVARYIAASFSIGTKVYIGTGTDGSDLSLRDFWEWDQTTNDWIRKADFPGNSTNGVVSFSIGTKGYIGTGDNFSTDGFTNSFTNEFWEYDPASNSWTQKASLPITPARAFAVGFSIGTKGYVGLGIKDASTAGGSPGYYQDFWEWDQTTDVWKQKADFPGNARSGAVGFSIGSKGYFGTGGNGNSMFKDFWEWDQATNVWTKKSDFGGASRWYAVGFSIGNKGYIGTGNNENLLKDIWEWNQTANVWTEKSDFKGDARTYAVGVSIDNKAYIGTGVGDNDFHALKDFWEYDPALK